MRIIPEQEFRRRLATVLACADTNGIGAVMGPGRSGAVAAVYASHMLGVPFIPYGFPHPAHLGRLLIIDTARESGRTLRKAARKYEPAKPVVIAVYEEPPRVAFWYESSKPQRYRHEGRQALPMAA